MGADDGRPGEDQGGLSPQDAAAKAEAEERARKRAHELYEATQDELGTNGTGEPLGVPYAADRLLGDRASEALPGDQDEAALARLEAHLRATGEYSPDGSVWRMPDIQASPAHQGALDPPEYAGPDERATGRHRESTPGKAGRRRWWHRWSR
jgi:hypothetical protein